MLEEEVVRLEQEVVHFRQGLYQEAVYISSSKRSIESSADSYPPYPAKNHKPERHKFSAQHVGDSAAFTRRLKPSISGRLSAKLNLEMHWHLELARFLQFCSKIFVLFFIPR